MAEKLAEKIFSILGHAEMTADIFQCLGDDAAGEYARMVERAAGRFESSAHYDIAIRLLQDHSKLRDDELTTFFEFLYSSLVNKFKGELAELFARPRIRDFAVTIGQSDAVTIFGDEIRERGVELRGGWLKGADAVLCHRTDDRLRIAGVVEIKAMQRPISRVGVQLRRHIVRMQRGGVQIGVATFAPESIEVLTHVGTNRPLADCTGEDVPRLIVRPWLASEDGAILPHPEDPTLWLAELPYTQDEITEAAYRFSSWYMAQLGEKAFHLPDEQPRGRRPAPFPDMTLEANGDNSFIEGLFGVYQRNIFQPRPPGAPRGGRRTPGDTFLWLYNSLCGGYEQANVDDIYFPEFEPDRAYEARLLKRNDAIAMFADGHPEQALELLPHPSEQTDLWWRRREWLMLARLQARAGAGEQAREALDAALREPASRNLAVPLEIAAVEALVLFAENQPALARERIDEAIAIEHDLRERIHAHESQRWAFPADIERRTLSTATADLAIGLALGGMQERAIELLRTALPIDTSDRRRLGNEPPLAPVAALLPSPISTTEELPRRSPLAARLPPTPT